MPPMIGNCCRQLRRLLSASGTEKNARWRHASTGRLYRWNDVLFSSTFNEIVRLENGKNIDLLQCSLFREKNLIKSFDRGFFTLMPFVVRSLEHLTRLVDDHMFRIGAQKVMMPSMVGKHLWVKSGRWDMSGQDIFRVNDRHQAEYCLAPTHEEVITQVMASTSQLSHRQLPLYLYQITPKYRDELRTKFGMLRAREFIMKDLYTFDKDEEMAKKTYETVCDIYGDLFRLLELPIVKTVGSVGTIGGKYSHEFLLETNLGEDEVYTCTDCHESFNAELLDEFHEDPDSPVHCLNCKSSRLTAKRRALELGHSFLLSDRYSRRMGALYSVEHSNKQLPLQMGCYGLGVSRILAASVEYLSAKYQMAAAPGNLEQDSPSSTNYQPGSHSIYLRWPRILVPFKICLILPKKDSKEDHGKGTEFCLHLARVIQERFGQDVLLDDRSNLTVGKRLLTAKIIGLPFIIVAGRNIMETRPKLELFDMYGNDKSEPGSCAANQPRLLTQSQLLNYLEQHLHRFQGP